MFLKTLELENIRSYKRERIDFREGIALFEGDIGSGKSTILYAIEFALFGLGDLKSTFLLRNGEKEGCVRLTMDVDNREISFMRSLERKKTGASQKQCCIAANGTRTEYSPEEMKAEALKILRFNENPSPTATSLIYRYAIFTPQEEMKEILRLREDLRLETLRRAFGIEEYKIARNNAALVSREIKEKETFLAGSIQGFDLLVSKKTELLVKSEKTKKDTGELIARRDAVLRKSALLKKKIDEHREAKAIFDKILGELPMLKKRLDDKNSRITEIEKTIAENNAEILEKKKQLLILEAEKSPTEKTEEELDEELKKIRKNINELSKEIGIIGEAIKDAEISKKEAVTRQKELDSVTSKIKSLGDIKNPTEKTKEEISAEISEGRSRIDKLLRESGATKEHAETFKKLIEEKICPTCRQEIDPSEFLKKSEDAKKEFQMLEEELKSLALSEKNARSLLEELAAYNLKKERLAGLVREKEMIESAYGAANKKSAGLESLNSSLAKASSELKQANLKEKEAARIRDALSKYVLSLAQISRINSEIDSAQSRIDSAKSMHSAAVSESSEIKSELEKKEHEIQEKEESAKQLKELEKEMDDVKRSGEILAKNIGEADAMQNAIDEELEKTGAELEKKETDKKERDRICETRMWLDDYFSSALVSIERHVLASINEEFNTLFQRLFRILMDENELNVTINEFFTPAVSQNGYEQDINALSGGERTSVALAYRLALNSVVKGVCGSLNNSSLLILDEPTDGFSKEQLMRLRDVLAELACRQVVIVSHERELESFADYIYRVRKTGGVSVVEKG